MIPSKRSVQLWAMGLGMILLFVLLAAYRTEPSLASQSGSRPQGPAAEGWIWTQPRAVGSEYLWSRGYGTRDSAMSLTVETEYLWATTTAAVPGDGQ